MRVVTAVSLILALPSTLTGQSTRPQDPRPPFPYDEVEVSLENPQDGTRLAGTLTLPDGEGPFPAVVLLSGAGPQDRDYAVFGHRPFLVLADYLARRGIAALRLDDRGTGGSAGDATRSTLALAIADVRAGVQVLGRHPRIDPGALGLVAHSEGGRVAPFAAAASDNIAFVVLLAPPVVSAAELSQGQAATTAAVSNDPLVPVQAALIDMIRRTLADESDPERALASIRANASSWMASLSPEVSRIMGILWARPEFQAQVEQLVIALGTPWNRSLYDQDPAPPLEALDVPVLALYGDRDLQVPPAQNATALEALWAEHPDARVEILPGLNHFFQHADTGLPAEIPDIEETFAPEAMDRISGWIEGRFTTR
ncbi:MAG: alpha/beta hydrolase [Gemmatimonadota bacterium]